MVEFYERPLAQTVKLDAYNKTRSIEIPRNRFIQEILLRVKGTYDTSATAPTRQEDQPFSLIKQLRLVANGNDILRAISGINLHVLNWFDLHGTVLEALGIKATGNLADEPFSFALNIPFKVNPLDPYDVGMLLPAGALGSWRGFSSLDLYVDWGANTDLATANAPTDIENKCEMEVALREVIINEEEASKLWGVNWERLLKNYITEVEKTIDASYSEFKFEYDMPTGMILRRMLLKAINNSLRSNAICPKYKVAQESPVRRDLFEREWYKSQIQDKAEYRTGGAWTDGAGVASAITVNGITILDFEKMPCIDTRGLKRGDVKLKANTGSPTATAKFAFVTEEFV